MLPSPAVLEPALHGHLHLQLLPKPSLRVSGFLAFPLNDGESSLGLPQLLDLALLDGLVLDKDDLDAALGGHVLQASLQLQQSLGALKDIVGAQHNQEAAASLDEAQGLIRDNWGRK